MGAPISAYLALLGLIVPTAFSLALLVANLREWNSSESFAKTVERQKPTIAIIIQVLSHTLGSSQILALCNDVNP
jgi:chromate transport protein ChrA